MPKLNDLQAILIATAAQRGSGSLYPLPASAAGTGARLIKALAALTKAGLAEEREAGDPETTARSDGDRRYGLFITPAGAIAIGVDDLAAGSPLAAVAPVAPAQRSSKTSEVVALLQREGGATLPELIAVTGWLPHTTRAALTGLRKKGHAIDRSKRDAITCYRIAVAG